MSISSIILREAGLPAVLSGGQMSMVAFGTVISYGLVSGSAFPLFAAGLAAVPAYLAGALVALALMACLSLLAARYPTPGAFGSYAESHLGPAAGFMVRAAYFISFVLIIGTEVSLLAPVVRAWAPQINAGLMLATALAGIAAVNVLGARSFARCEVALSAAKILALVALVGLAFHYAVSGAQMPARAPVDLSLVIQNVPFSGVWQAFLLAVLGFVGIESLAIVAAETKATAQALRRGMRLASLAVVGLALAAVTASAALVHSGKVSLFQPPFATLLELAGMPWPNTLFRVLVVVTVLSVLNSQMYCASRMLFSLARAGQAPGVLGRSSASGPARAVIATAGLSLTVFLVNAWSADGFHTIATAVATTGLLGVWFAIFLTCLRYWRGRYVPAADGSKPRRLGALTAGCCAVLIAAIAMSTMAVDAFSSTLRIGLPFLLLLWLGYVVLTRALQWKRSQPSAPGSQTACAPVN
ncbi:amino acid permease [Achromobacter arsenitoxydans]|uniref:Amino acid permease n=1 Tax=Achromobacter arsenitoxydans SY8 TaxID=477184 RepID=H0F0F4_9BURK|nr:amino acid permease [Achromobacter arsenitoxydans]EHK68230.1 amino acid permease [Achromobacter arsenitoxydans SY8]